MKILVIAPHPDDEIIGCGGVISKRIYAGDEVWVCVVSEGQYPMYSKKFIEEERKEMLSAHKYLGVHHTVTLGFPSAKLDQISQHEINDRLCRLVEEINPTEVFIPHRGDVHRDHQIVADAALVALRPKGSNKVKKILAYEVLSETDWNIPNEQNAFIPNVYEDITKQINNKLGAMKKYRSQLKEYPAARSNEGIKALAKHRGVTVGKKYAEAFMLIREVDE